MVAPIDVRYLTHYAAIALGLDQPVLEALHHYYYWSQVQAIVDQYQASPDTFPWEQHQDPNILLEIVRVNGRALTHVSPHIANYPAICLAAVQNRGDALMYVNADAVGAHLHDIRLAAVTEWPEVLCDMKDQTLDICLTAVQANEWTIEYVDDQTLELCLIAVKADIRTMAYIRDPDMRDAMSEVIRGLLRQ